VTAVGIFIHDNLRHMRDFEDSWANYAKVPLAAQTIYKNQ